SCWSIMATSRLRCAAANASPRWWWRRSAAFNSRYGRYWMQPSVARVGMARLGASLLCLGLLAAPAAAADRALLDLIGYSDDAGFFAFEEFGIQDGSGFAYSSIYIVDLSEDEWVIGTPIRVQASTEETSLSQVRQEARDKAEGEIAALGIDRPAELVALVGDGAPGLDGANLR